MRKLYSTLIERTPLGSLPPRHRGPALLAVVAGSLLIVAMIGLVVVLASPPGDRDHAKIGDDNAAQQVAFSFDKLPATVVEENPLADPVPPVSDPPSNSEPSAGPPVIADNPAASPPKIDSSQNPETSSRPQPAATSQASPPDKTARPPATNSKSSSSPSVINPFADFPAAVSLPAVENTNETSLGPIRVPENYICVLYLLGGEGVARGRTNFRCDNAEQGTRERAWEIFADDTSRTAPEVLIARLQLTQQELRFAWTPEAAACEGAAGLANCALKISAGKGVHKLALRKPKQVGFVPIKFEKTTITWDVPNTPRPDRVQIEFLITTPKDSKELRPRFLGKSIIPATVGETWVEFGLKPEDRFLKLQIEARLNAQSLEIVLTPFFQLLGQAKPLAVTEGNIKKVEESLVSAANAASAQLRALGPEPKPSKDKKNNKSPSEPPDPRTQVAQRLAGIRKAQAQLKLLKSQEATFTKQVRLQVRANHLADEAIVQLVEPRK